MRAHALSGIQRQTNSGAGESRVSGAASHPFEIPTNAIQECSVAPLGHRHEKARRAKWLPGFHSDDRDGGI